MLMFKLSYASLIVCLCAVSNDNMKIEICHKIYTSQPLSTVTSKLMFFNINNIEITHLDLISLEFVILKEFLQEAFKGHR